MKFVKKYQRKNSIDLGDILMDINRMVSTDGARENFFKMEEGKKTDNVCALPNRKSKLRLYCLRYSNIAVILGGGGEKGKGPYQDYPILLKNVELLQEISRLIYKRIRDREIYWENDKLSGNLEFKIEE
ncbi:MAG: hypothetical protein HY959_08600 [Ignavibacteriae bacterium]|nr:hypothetical protein [Ignavibacteriota bacterium]